MNFKKGVIEGVFIKKLTKYSDERGCLFETFRKDFLPSCLELEMCYVAFTKPGVTRGPHEHLKQTDVTCFIGPGSFQIKLWNNRKNCKTYGNIMEITGGRGNPILIIIPPGIVHGYKNISEEMGIVINYSDKLYKGWNKLEEVDEIRHEDAKDDFSLDFISEDY